MSLGYAGYIVNGNDDIMYSVNSYNLYTLLTCLDTAIAAMPVESKSLIEEVFIHDRESGKALEATTMSKLRNILSIRPRPTRVIEFLGSLANDY